MSVTAHEGAKLRTLIRDLSKRASGFTRSDASGLAIHSSLISKRCNQMLSAGVIFAGKVRGQTLHYFATEVAARLWEAAQPPYKKQRTLARRTAGMSQAEKSQVLTDVILRAAASTAGFATVDKPDCVQRFTVLKRCASMVRAGNLFAASVGLGKLYFTTQEAASNCRAAFLETLHAQLLIRRAAKVAVRVEREVKVRQIRLRVERKPWVAPVKKDVETIYPPGYKHTYAVTPPQRTQAFVFSFIHNGMRAM